MVSLEGSNSPHINHLTNQQIIVESNNNKLSNDIEVNKLATVDKGDTLILHNTEKQLNIINTIQIKPSTNIPNHQIEIENSKASNNEEITKLLKSCDDVKNVDLMKEHKKIPIEPVIDEYIEPPSKFVDYTEITTTRIDEPSQCVYYSDNIDTIDEPSKCVNYNDIADSDDEDTNKDDEMNEDDKYNKARSIKKYNHNSDDIELVLIGNKQIDRIESL
jgi:hypothetical protein